MKTPQVDDLQPLKQVQSRVARIICVGAIVGYAIVLGLKARGLMPPHITWTKALIGPAVFFGLATLVFFVPLYVVCRRESADQAKSGSNSIEDT
jgi:hypothetical protein